MKNQSRKIEIFLKDGFFVGVIKAGDVDNVLKAIEGHSMPSSIAYEKEGKLMDAEFLEITSGLRVSLDTCRTQYFHKEQILAYYKGTNLF